MAFDPATLSGKAVWLRAKDLGATGSTVSDWPDQSGLGNNAVVQSGAPTVAGASTPGGGKSLRLNATPLNLPNAQALGLTAGPIFATASSVYAGSADYAADKAVDGDISTFWSSANAPSTGVPQWLRLQPTTPLTVTAYTITPRADQSSHPPRDFTFQGSMDATAWTDLDVRAGIIWATTAQTFTFTNATAYTYYRLLVTATSSGDVVDLAEITLNNTPNTRISTPGEMWLVVKTDGGSGPTAWKFGTNASSSHYTYGGTVYDDFGNATRRSFTPTLDPLQWRVYRVGITATGSWFAELDTISQLTASGVTIAWNPAAAIPLAGTFSGNIAEVLVRSQVSTPAEAADIYAYLRAEHFGEAPPSDGGNDAWADAIVITLPTTGDTYVSDPIPTTTATTEPGEPGGAAKTLWWSYTPSESGNATFDTQLSTAINVNDTKIYVYTGTAVDALTLLATDDDSGGGGTSKVTVPVVGGTTYHIRAGMYSSAYDANLVLRATGPTTAPRVPKAPKNLTFDPATPSITMVATWDPQYQCTYEVRVDGGTITPVTDPTYTLTGLTDGTVYTVEVRAINSVGAGPWASGTFTAKTLRVYDTFDRANSTTTVGAPVIGPAGTVLSGAWGISTNRLYSSTVPTTSFLGWDFGTADLAITVSKAAGPVNTGGIFFGAKSTTDCWYAYFSGDPAYPGYVARVMGTVVTPVKYMAKNVAVLGARQRVAVCGNVVRCYVNNELLLETTLPEPIGGTYVGIRSTSTSLAWDDLTIADVVPFTLDGGTGTVPSPAQHALASPPSPGPGFIYKGRDSRALDTLGAS